MKRFWFLSVLGILMLLVSACSGSTGQVPQTGGEDQSQAPASTGEGSKELNLYGWSEYVPQALLDGFTEETGIRVNYDTYSSNEEMLAKLMAGGSGYDVIIPSDYMVDIMIKQGMLEKIDLAQIPNFENVDEQFRSLYYDPGNQYSIPYQWGTVGLVYNSEYVKEEPQSWSVLWDPQYAGKVVVLDDSREVMGMVLRTLNFDKNSANEDELNQAAAKLGELMPNIKLFDSDSPKTALLSDEVWLGLTWNGEAALAHQENENIQYTCPQEGCGIWFDNLAIPKGAPHPDAAHAFLNYVLEPEASLLITAEFPYSNPNKAALELMKTQDPEAYDAYTNFAATNPSPEDVENAHPVKDVGEATVLWDQLWTEIKGNQ